MNEEVGLYLVDESHIESRHDRTISEVQDLSDHVGIVNHALQFISTLPMVYEHKDEDELVLLRLGVRCFNSGAASLKLLRCGYYQPALAMIRDIIETTLLLDLFERDRTAIKEWRTLPAKKRERLFSPVQVRSRLDELDGYQDQKRKAAYKLLSIHAAHPTPEGFQIISPNNMTKVGPFPDEGRLRAVLQELTKYLVYAGSILSNHIKSEDPKVLDAQGVFLNACEKWWGDYMSAVETD